MPSLAPGQDLAGLPVVARVPQIRLLVLQGTDVLAARTALAAVPGIAYIEADAVASASMVPNDQRFAGQYGATMVGLPAAWSQAGLGSAAVTVAVLDSGITASHPDFQGTRMLAGYDYVNRDAFPNDDCGHGTHVSGVLGARTNNTIGVAGASQATFLPLKVLDGGCSGFVSNVAQALVDATDRHAAIITMSLGTTTNTQALAHAVAYAGTHGATIVAAAGNGGRDDSVAYPAAYPQAIAVSAMDATMALAGYSSRGAKIEVSAPGSNIDSTTLNGGYGRMSGTSMATPLVAGALALALSCAPGASSQDLRASLDATAQDIGPAGRDAQFGYGMVRPDLLVQRLCQGPAPANRAPTATFTHTESGLSTTVTAASSSDPDGDRLAYAWDFGDNATLATLSGTHAFTSAGTYTVALAVSDGRGGTGRQSQAVTVAAPAFTPLFTVAKGSNEWWVEVSVAGNAPVAGVAVMVHDGTSRPLPRTSWGSWASSFYVAKGSAVTFSATSGSGETAFSPAFKWLGPPPPSGALTIFFEPRTTSNPWWVEVAVSGNQPLSTVAVHIGDAAWSDLPRTSWGTWAKSIHVLAGTQVIFRASTSSGAAATSAAYTWT